jgi:DNA-binding HxlR family transcriptional regulator
MKSNKNMNENIAWIGLREIYRLLGTQDGNAIVRLLLNKGSIRTKELITSSGIPPARFHVIMRTLVICQVVDRKVHEDRSVSYSISPFGKNLLQLSEPLLNKIAEEFKDKESLLLNMVHQKEKDKPVVSIPRTT